MRRFALGAGRKRVQRPLGALGVLDRSPVGVVDRGVRLEAGEQMRPLFVGDRTRRDDVLDDGRFGAVVRVAEEMNKILARIP